LVASATPRKQSLSDGTERRVGKPGKKSDQRKRSIV
jgi:hypothetical protein